MSVIRRAKATSHAHQDHHPARPTARRAAADARRRSPLLLLTTVVLVALTRCWSPRHRWQEPSTPGPSPSRPRGQRGTPGRSRGQVSPSADQGGPGWWKDSTSVPLTAPLHTAHPDLECRLLPGHGPPPGLRAAHRGPTGHVRLRPHGPATGRPAPGPGRPRPSGGRWPPPGWTGTPVGRNPWRSWPRAIPPPAWPAWTLRSWAPAGPVAWTACGPTTSASPASPTTRRRLRSALGRRPSPAGGGQGLPGPDPTAGSDPQQGRGADAQGQGQGHPGPRHPPGVPVRPLLPTCGGSQPTLRVPGPVQGARPAGRGPPGPLPGAPAR